MSGYRRPRRSRWTFRLAAAYVVLLAASWAVRLARPDPPPRPGREAIDVQAMTPAGPSARRVRLAYRDLGHPIGPSTLPVLLVHGSPGTSGDFTSVAPALAATRRVLVPDLPGFGDSTRRVPDYSLASHAEYLLALLDRLDVPRVHLVGFSMGGGVALELAARAPSRVASMTMLSAIGVQELELFGAYGRNHAVHGLQLAGLWLLHRAAPHFGYLDDAMLDVPYARNFFDSDQRPLRGILQQVQAPTLIVHGRRDPLVPYAAALEHHRLVPQSELRTIDEGDHFMVFRDGRGIAAVLEEFLARVDRGEAPDRQAAGPARVAAAQRPFTMPAEVDSPLATLVGWLLAGAVVVLVAVLLIGAWRVRRRRRFQTA